MAAKLGNLQIDISANVAKIARDMGKVTKTVDGAAKKMTKTVKGLKRAFATLIGIETIRRVAMFGKEMINFADNIGKVSKQTGITTETLSALAFGADLAGTSIATVNTGIKVLARNMYDAAQGTGEAKDVFNRLGISVLGANGNLRNTDDVLKDVADKFAMMKDGAEKSAAAQKIFGRSGQELIPLLNDGAKGLAELRKQTEKYNTLLTRFDTAAAEEFNDNLRRMEENLRGIGLTATNFAAGFNYVFDLLSGGGKTSKMVENAKAIKVLNEELKKFDRQRKEVDDKIELFKGDPEGMVFEELLDRAILIEETVMRKKAKIKKLADEINAIMNPNVNRKTLPKQEPTIKPTPLDDKYYMTEAKKFSDERIALEKKTAEEMTKEADAFFDGYDQNINALKTDYENKMQMMRNITDTWAGDAADAIVDFTQTGKLSFSSMVNSMLADLVRMSTQKAFAPFLGQLFSGLLGGSSFTGSKAAGDKLSKNTGNASGGIINQPTVMGGSWAGEKGTEAVMPLARIGGDLGVKATPSNVIVQVVDQRSSGQQPEVTTTKSGGMEMIKILIRDETNRNIRSGTLDGSMSSAFGLSRKGLSR